MRSSHYGTQNDLDASFQNSESVWGAHDSSFVEDDQTPTNTYFQSQSMPQQFAPQGSSKMRLQHSVKKEHSRNHPHPHPEESKYSGDMIRYSEGVPYQNVQPCFIPASSMHISQRKGYLPVPASPLQRPFRGSLPHSMQPQPRQQSAQQSFNLYP